MITVKSGLLSIFRGSGGAAGNPGMIPPPRTAKAPRPLPAAVEPVPVRPVDAIPPPRTTESVRAMPGTGRLVFAVDATSSRQKAWEAAKRLTDDVLGALPGELDVALAVHGGDRVHTFTEFTSDAAELRGMAAGVRCIAGYTRLVEILRRVAAMSEDVAVVVYIGDVFEESRRDARQIAVDLAQRGTRVIILHDTGSRDTDDGKAFAELAKLTGGAVLPFDASALERLGQLLEAVAVLAVGGTEMLETKQATMPAATLLLEHLGERKRIGRR